MDEQNLPMDEELDNRLIMTDEDGNDVEYEFLDVVYYNEQEYVILLPVGDDDGLVVIFRVEGEGDDEMYIGVDSEEEAEAVFQLFKAQAADDFDFTD